MDAMIRLVVSSVIRSGIYRMLRGRKGTTLIGVVGIAIIVYVWMHS